MKILNFIKKIYIIILSCLSLEPRDKRINIIKKHIFSESRDLHPNCIYSTKYNIAIESVRDPLFYALFALIVGGIRKKISIDSYLLFVTSINSAVGVGWIQKISRSKVINWIINSQWKRASVPILGNHIAYKSQSFSNPVLDFKDWLVAEKIWASQKSKNDISRLTVDGVLVGDLIIDSYLRFRPSPEFKISDPFVRSIIWQALRDLRKARDFFSKIKPVLYLTSYSTYIEHGIAVRVALQFGVKVRTYGHIAAFGKRLEKSDFFHTPNTSNYSKIFLKLKNQSARLRKAEKCLNFRLSGGIDPATSYMKISAYKSNNKDVPNVSGQIVIFLHDFYDSPHIYPDLIFTDFWSWIVFTINTLQKNQVKFWIKPHPNQIDLSDEAMKDLIEKFPNLRIIAPGVTTNQLAKAGMRLGVTVYGTVAHELAYMGIPSISCAKDPHHAFDFCFRASNKIQYKSLLLNNNSIPFNQILLKKQALQFFYMHNLHHGNTINDLLKKYSVFTTLMSKKEIDRDSIEKVLNSLQNSKGFKDHINELSDDIVSFN